MEKTLACKSITANDEMWMDKFRNSYNILSGLPPNVPILVENIPEYIRRENYDDNCIKNILTVGMIKEEPSADLKLLSITPDLKTAEIQLSFDNFRSYALWPRSSDGLSRRLWVNGQVYRIWGILKQEEGQPVLYAYGITPVDDRHSALALFQSLSKLARYSISQFTPTDETRGFKFSLKKQQLSDEEMF